MKSINISPLAARGRLFVTLAFSVYFPAAGETNAVVRYSNRDHFDKWVAYMLELGWHVHASFEHGDRESVTFFREIEGPTAVSLDVT